MIRVLKLTYFTSTVTHKLTHTNNSYQANKHIDTLRNTTPTLLNFFLLNAPATPEISPLPLHDALPISNPLQRLEGDAERDGQQRRAVHEGGDDLEPQQAERPLRGGRALGQVGDDERQAQGGDVVN